MFRISLIVIFVAFFGFTSASTDQCRGKCPEGYPDGVAVLIPHEECDKYCSCVYGRPVEMPCPPGLHYSEKDHVCTDPYLANCDRSSEFISEQISMSLESELVQSLEEDDAEDECIGECPDGLHEYYGITVVLAHKECHKFCKCNSNGTLVQKCPKNLHFSLEFSGCTYPAEAKCRGIIDDKSSEGLSTGCCACSTTTQTPGDPSGCIGTCPIWVDDKVVHLPHKDCTKFCKCDFGAPHVISCKDGLHFNPILQVCDRPSQAGCSPDSHPTTSHVPGPTTPPGPIVPTGDPSGCIGTCPLWEGDKVVHLPHRDCTQFCKCDFGVPHVMSCQYGLHFNPILQVCDRPSQAGCSPDSHPTTPHVPGPTTPRPITTRPPPLPPGPTVPTGDPSGCIGTCPLWEGDKVVHLPHRDCTQFCKCDFGVPHVMSCQYGLHFNPILQVCDRPSQAGCSPDSHPTTPHVPGPTTPRPITTRPPPLPPGPTVPTGDPSGCIGTCPLWEGDKVVHLPHRDCTQFCKCDFGVPHVMSCQYGLHFNPILQVCDRPSQAGCSPDSHPTTPHVPGPTTPRPITTRPPPLPPGPTVPTGDPSGCIGTCPLWEGDKVVHLPHRDCTQFCKCDFGVPHVMSCQYGLHFNPILQVCDRPSQAGCSPDSHPTTSHVPGPTAPPGPTVPTGDPSGCIGTCPLWEGDKVVHLPHRDCTQFCKCDFGVPHVMSCQYGLHFNPILQVCDRPSQAGCSPDSHPTTPHVPGPTTPRPITTRPPPLPPGPTVPTGDPSGCIGTCPLWEGDKVVHLPHRDCTQFCKCDFGVPHVMSCQYGLHFNPILQVCDRPSQAGCSPDSHPTTPHVPGPTATPGPIPPTGDPSGCIGTCPLWEGDKVVHLPHRDCTQFCKCDFGVPHVMSCQYGLHFNPILQVCDRPSQAGCSPDSHPTTPHVPGPTTPRPITTRPPPLPPGPTVPTGDPSGCIGTCPLWEGDKVVHLPHRDCTQFCKCDFGVPHVMSCQYGLHFNPILQVCDRPSQAGCSPDSHPTTPHVPGPTTPRPITTRPPPLPPGPTVPTGDPSGCIGTCPLWEGDKVVHLPHRDCTQFCKCDFGVPHVMSCQYGLHFNPILQVCDRPSQAGCSPDSHPTTPHVPGPTTPRPITTRPPPLPPGPTVPTGDPSGCIGTCPLWEGDKVVHLPHRDCTQFCKCDFGVPHVMSCQYGLHFNPILQVCDRPSQAGCSPDSHPTTPHVPGPTATPGPIPPTGDPSGCIGTCPLWEGDKVVHLPHRDCTQFCKCDFGVPHVMSCQYGLHFNPTLQVCDRPSQAGCKGDRPIPISSGSPGPIPKPTEAAIADDTSGCIGACPLWEGDNVVHLPHKDCTKFCKCDFGIPHVMPCRPGLHFNPKLGVCDRPSHAGCGGNTPESTTTTFTTPSSSSTFPSTSSTPDDTSGCIGTCPLWEGDDVVHLPHKDCTKFCKCDFGAPHVMTCQSGLHFNPKLGVCDRPSHAGCSGWGGLHDSNNSDDIARKNIMGFNRLFRW